MNVDTKTKVLLKFGSLETVCVDKRFTKLPKLSRRYICNLSLSTHSRTCELFHILSVNSEL